MAILMKFHAPGATTDQYDRTNEIAGVRDNVPDGLISHVCGTTDDGLLIVDVWESQEALDRFFEERLGAALHEAGVPPVEPHIYPVHAMIPQGAGTQANVIMIVKAAGLTPDAYDAMTAKMPSQANGGEGHPVVSHVAAVTGDGLLIVDLWDSPEAFLEFASTELAAAAPDMPPMEPRFVPVYNRIRGKAPVAA